MGDPRERRPAVQPRSRTSLSPALLLIYVPLSRRADAALTGRANQSQHFLKQRSFCIRQAVHHVEMIALLDAIAPRMVGAALGPCCLGVGLTVKVVRVPLATAR